MGDEEEVCLKDLCEMLDGIESEDDKSSYYSDDENSDDESSFSSEKELDECVVCFTLTYDMLECNHCVCKKCVEKLNKMQCPICRKRIDDEIEFTDEDDEYFARVRR